MRKLEKKKTYCCYIDVKKAFDRVWRDGLWHRLRRSGVEGKMLRVLKAMYVDVKAAVLMADGSLTDEFPIATGVRQGCVLSPTLFNIFINDLIVQVKKAGLGVRIDKERLAALLYADDIVLLAECGKDLQKLMDMVTEHLTKYRLQINHNKSAVVVYGPGRKENRQYKMGSMVIPLKEDYKYLGMIIQNASWTKTKESMARKASKAMSWSWNLLMRLGAPTVRAMVSVWTALVRPLLEYGAEIWPGENSHQWKEADALQRKMAKRILDCKRTMPNEVVLGELGVACTSGEKGIAATLFLGEVNKDG